MAQIVGGCRCGQVRYSGNAEPAFTGVCHCTNCQKETGAAFNIVVAVPQAALTIQGSPKTYTSKGDSGSRSSQSSARIADRRSCRSRRCWPE